ncbi:MAG: hypothetical protein KC546_23040, partial [Anaerolineae bacterium]|nr:hypothetical protein [Anaerolineae bacterium]
MKRLFLLILTLLLTSGLVATQEQSPYDIALERIEAARISGATELYFSSSSFSSGLESLPPELFELTELTHLYLHIIGLKTLPSEISQLTNLSLIDVFGNELTE